MSAERQKRDSQCPRRTRLGVCPRRKTRAAEAPGAKYRCGPIAAVSIPDGLGFERGVPLLDVGAEVHPLHPVFPHQLVARLEQRLRETLEREALDGFAAVLLQLDEVVID